MPNWKKVIVSGSDASLNSLTTPAGTINNITASNAITASYALNGGVTQLLAGPNITLSPTNGLGQVTVTATLSGSNSYNTATGSYGSFYDTTTQTNPVANIARSMSFNSTDITNGVSISGSTSPFNTYIKTENAGIYNIQFSAQVDKTDGGTDDIVIWLRKNGIDLTDTATTLTLPTNNSKVVAAWNWFVSSATGDYYQIIWRSADTDLRLLAEPISVDHPGIPSVILTVNRVDQFLSNTGSFSGSFTGTLTGTASYATQALTASYALTSSYSFDAISASHALTASSVNPLNQTVQITGSLQVQNSIDSSNRFLIDSTGTASLDWEDGYLYNGSGSISVDWRDRKLYDSNVDNSVNWNSRELFKSDGTTVTLNWETGAFTGSMLGTASYAVQALTASYTPSISGTDNYIPRFNGSNALENSVIYDNGLQIGIGTTTPNTLLSIAWDAGFSSTLDITNTNANGDAAIDFYSNTYMGTIGAYKSLGLKYDSYNTGDHYFQVFSNTAMFIKGSTSNVGIGTTSPAYKLSVVGKMALNDGGNSVFIGTNAGQSDDATDNRNIAIGTNASQNNLSGSQNVAIGYNSLVANTSINNTAVGSNTLQFATTAINNSTFGSFALNAATVGSGSTGIGTSALILNTVGNHNTAVGNSALRSNISGSNNVGIGGSVMFNNANGNDNVAIGWFSGRYFGTGTSSLTDTSGSIFLGTLARANASGEVNQIVIGMNALGLGSNSVVLGNDNITKTVLKGSVGIGTTSPGVKLQIAGGTNSSSPTLGSGTVGTHAILSNDGFYGLYSGVSNSGDVWQQVQRNDASSATYNLLLQPSNGYVGIGTLSPAYLLDVNGTARVTSLIETSAAKYKTNIQPLDSQLSKVAQLEPVTFDWIDKPNPKTNIGLIADEVEKIYPEFVSKTEDGEIEGIEYSKLTIVLIQSIKELKEIVEKQQEQINTLLNK